MQFKKIADYTKSIYVALEPDELRTDFDTGVTKVTLEYFNGKPDKQDSLCEIKIEMSNEFIADTYRLSGDISKDAKIKTSFDLGGRVYQEKKGAPEGFETVRAQSNSPLRYIPKIDMQPIN